MAVTNCHLQKELYDRLVRMQYGLLCNAKPTNELFLESYIHKLECQVIDMTCKNTEPCDLTVCTLNTCNLQTQQLIGVQYPADNNTVNLFGFTLDLSQIYNGVAPYTTVWTYDTANWELDESTENSLTLFATETLVSGTIIRATVTDANGCTIKLQTSVSYKVGCTDPDAINYDPFANIDSGNCFDTSLTLVVGYNCNEDGDGVLVVSPSGGIPPYTITGNQNGEVILNGENYTCYATDSIGNVTSSISGTIVCPLVPPDCLDFPVGVDLGYTCLTDELGNPTGQAQLTILVIGGTPPFLIGGGSDGQIVNDGDMITVFVTDSNGCMSAEANVTIDCPPYVPIPECDKLRFTYNGLFSGKKTGFSVNDYRLKYNLAILLTPGITITSVEHEITDNLTNQVFNFTNVSSSGVLDFSIDQDPDPASPSYNISIAVTITLSNSCIYSYEYVETGLGGTTGVYVLLNTETHTFNP